MQGVSYLRLTSLPTSIIELEADAVKAGFRMVSRLRREWEEGRNRFDAEGEALFGAERDGVLVGVAGLNRDPYCPDASTGRLRHLYVLQRCRRFGIGRALVGLVADHARSSFASLRLWTDRAGGFYDHLGFQRVSGDRVTHVFDLGRRVAEASSPVRS